MSGSISWAAPEHFGAAVAEFISAQEKDVSEGVNRNFQQVPRRARACLAALTALAGGGVLQEPSAQAAQDEAGI